MLRATMKPPILSLLILAAFSALAGCGTKTPLVKPAGPATPPVFGAPAPQSSPATAPQSNSATAPQSSPATAPQSTAQPVSRDDSNKAVAP